MGASHRNGDSRYCGAATTVVGQSTVYVNGLLASVEGDPETHGNGQLVSASAGTVRINGKKAIIVGDTAVVDSAGHPPGQTNPASGSGTVSYY